MKKLFTPFAEVSAGTMLLIGLLTYAAVIVLWFILPSSLLPSPLEVGQQFIYLVTEGGLFYETSTSFILNLQATVIAGTLAVILAYLWVFPIMRQLVAMFENWRYAGLVGIGFYFMLIFHDAHYAKLAAVVFVMLPYILTSLCDSVRSIEEGTINHARTLRLSPLHTVWEIGIWGSRDRAIEAVRQNCAIGWATTAAVESFIRTEGGVGIMLVDQIRYLKLADFAATLLFVLVLGLFQNKALHWIRDFVSPYAKIGKGTR